jgi:hypothetical protein
MVPTASAILWDDFQSGWSLVSGGTITNNSTEHYKTGTGSLKCVATASTNLFAGKTISQSLSGVSSVGLWVYVESPIGDQKQTAQISCTVFFFSAGFTKSLASSNANQSLNHGWNWLSWGRGEFTLSGGATWADVNDVCRIKVFGYTGSPITMHLDSLYFNLRSLPLVLIDFDDGWDSTKSEAFDYMQPLGLVGNVYLVSSFVGQSNRVTVANVQAMYAAGWDIVNHTETHQVMTAYTQAQSDPEWNNCRDYIRTNGWDRRNSSLHTGTPTGGYGAGVLASLAANNYISGRNGEGALVAPFPEEIYHDKVHSVDGTTENTAAQLIAHVNRAVDAGMGIRLVFHRIITGAPSVASEIGRTAFRGLMDYLAKHNGVDLLVVTRTQFEELQRGRRLPALP